MTTERDTPSGMPTPPAASELPRRVDKPWGHEMIWAWTDRYVGKILVIETGKRLSLQHHEFKDEWVHVLDGRLLLWLENDAGEVEQRELGPGEGAHVATRRIHRYEALETCRAHRGLDTRAGRRRAPRGRLRARGHLGAVARPGP